VNKAIVLYLHVHQPYRIKQYDIFAAGHDQNYFNDDGEGLTNNQFIINKVSEKSYLPTNKALLRLLNTYPDFKVSLSITGTVIEQLEMWRPDVLDTFREIVATGKVEIVAETYHHSLAFFYSRNEFEAQVRMHAEKIQAVFGVTPKVFRNTELSYNNELASWADQAGYKGILAEGWDPVLDWRNANFVYRPVNTSNIRLLMKNYKLSDDIAFRFGDQGWSEWPLKANKYCHWLESIHDAQIFNLFMDYETFGEHQWADTGIFEFLQDFAKQWLSVTGRGFLTISEAIDLFPDSGEIDTPNTITWADTERDLSAWLGNAMQQQAISALYDFETFILGSNDFSLIADWRNLQTSDHFYYMCTKWFKDGDIHAYFSPYDSPYEAFMNFMNAYQNIRLRLANKGLEV
jgi:alpha-amylase